MLIRIPKYISPKLEIRIPNNRTFLLLQGVIQTCWQQVGWCKISANAAVMTKDVAWTRRLETTEILNVKTMVCIRCKVMGAFIPHRGIIFRDVPVRVRVLFFAVRVSPQVRVLIFPVRSGFEKKSDLGFYLWSGFHFFQSRFHFQYVLFINGLFLWNWASGLS